MNVKTTGLADVKFVDLKTGKVIAEFQSIDASLIEINYKQEEEDNE